MGIFSCEGFNADQIHQIAVPLRVIAIFFSISIHILVISSLIWWYVKRNDLIYLRKRSYGSALLIAVGTLFVLHSGMIARTFKLSNQYPNPCFIRNLLFIAGFPLFVLGPLNSILLFRWRAQYSAAMASREKEHELSSWNRLVKKPYFRTLQTTITFSVVLLLSSIASVFLCRDDCYTISIDTPVFLVIIFILLAIITIEVVYVYWKLKTYPDPFRILYSVMWGHVLAQILGLPLTSIGILVEKNYVEELFEGEILKVNGGIFIDISVFFFFIYFVPYQIYRAYKFNIQTAVHEEITLSIVLNDQVGHDLLKKHLTNEFSVENILFLDALKAVEAANPEDKSALLRNVYNDFIKNRYMNICSPTYSQLDELYTSDTLTLESFETAKKEIAQLIEFDSFTRFKNSKDFLDYIGLAASARGISLLK